MLKMVLAAFALALTAQSASAAMCDYRPSNWIISKIAVGTSAAVGSSGAGMSAAGLYAFSHATAGAMLGSTAAGTSAAGTTGIIAGSGGLVGTAGGILLNPWLWGPAAVIGFGGGAFELGCYALTD